MDELRRVFDPVIAAIMTSNLIYTCDCYWINVMALFLENINKM